MNADKLTATLFGVAVVTAIIASIVLIVTDIKQTLDTVKQLEDMREIRHRLFAFIEAKEKPFEATGYIVKRLEDGRFLISFSKPFPEFEEDRMLTNDVILSHKDFNAFQSQLIPQKTK